MATFVQTLDLRDDPLLIEAYRRHHDEIWPEVAAAIRETGVEDLKIYVDGRRLVLVMSGPDGFDPVASFASYRDNPAARRWEILMQTMQQQLPDAAPGEWWRPMELLFDLQTAGAGDE